MNTLRFDATLSRSTKMRCQVTHELRESQLESVVLGRRDAPDRLAMFLRMLERRTGARRTRPRLPFECAESDTAHYLGLTLEAVIRANRTVERGVVALQASMPRELSLGRVSSDSRRPHSQIPVRCLRSRDSGVILRMAQLVPRA
jgi:hypothetical protein